MLTSKDINILIDSLRHKLENLALHEGLDSAKVLILSKEIDLMMNCYYTVVWSENQ